MAGTNDDGWSALLPELLLAIVTRTSSSTADRIRFGSVCTQWRSLLTEFHHLLPPTDPLLMLPYTKDPYPSHFYGLPRGWVHQILLPDSQIESILPPNKQKMIKAYQSRPPPIEQKKNPLKKDPLKKDVFGLSMGWLFLDDYGVISLWNPVTRAEIPLPSPVIVPIFYKIMTKAVLSSNPNSEDCVVMVIGRCTAKLKLSFCRVGDEKWTVFNQGCFSDPGCVFEDVVFYRGQFYAVTCQGKVALCDIGPNPKLMQVGMDVDDPKDDIDGKKNYLVESSGELLKVSRYFKSSTVHRSRGDGSHEDRNLTLKFVVYKLDSRGGAETWSKVENIGDRALFLGASSSVSFAAGKVHDGGCRRNCIYFLDDLGCSDTGIFDFQDGSISRFSNDPYRWDYYKFEFPCTPQFWISLAPF